jgi:hypothetical protein
VGAWADADAVALAADWARVDAGPAVAVAAAKARATAAAAIYASLRTVLCSHRTERAQSEQHDILGMPWGRDKGSGRSFASIACCPCSRLSDAHDHVPIGQLGLSGRRNRRETFDEFDVSSLRMTRCDRCRDPSARPRRSALGTRACKSAKACGGAMLSAARRKPRDAHAQEGRVRVRLAN